MIKSSVNTTSSQKMHFSRKKLAAENTVIYNYELYPLQPGNSVLGD